MKLELYLCKNGTALNGEILLSGAQSGFSVRALVGSVAPDGSLTLQETKPVEEGHAAEWKFCSDTRYSLTPQADGFVRGTYRSNECDDSAAVFLIPDEVPPTAPTSTAPTSTAPTSTAPTSTAPTSTAPISPPPATPAGVSP